MIRLLDHFGRRSPLDSVDKSYPCDFKNILIHQLDGACNLEYQSSTPKVGCHDRMKSEKSVDGLWVVAVNALHAPARNAQKTNPSRAIYHVTIFFFWIILAWL